MTKKEFIECVNALRRYWEWENNLSDMGIEFTETPAASLADTILNILTKNEEDWGFDPEIGTNWIVTWSSAPYNQIGFSRKSQRITLRSAEDLWDFVNEMEEKKWPKQIENVRWLR